MLARLAALPRIGCGTLIIAVICGVVASKLFGQTTGRWVLYGVFFGVLGTVVLAAIVGPRSQPPAADDEAPPPTRR